VTLFPSQRRRGHALEECHVEDERLPVCRPLARRREDGHGLAEFGISRRRGTRFTTATRTTGCTADRPKPSPYRHANQLRWSSKPRSFGSSGLSRLGRPKIREKLRGRCGPCAAPRSAGPRGPRPARPGATAGTLAVICASSACDASCDGRRWSRSSSVCGGSPRSRGRALSPPLHQDGLVLKHLCVTALQFLYERGRQRGQAPATHPDTPSPS